ncbi:MAG: 6-carboxytetrahydropterin synthase QueD [Oscillospiraceae bacterium]|nr:6-carboxytetrahydropterin synthase QueD [Oscillospiraceae bacterium]
MYTLRTEAAFDSAHFLHGYNGKCSNLHGHRWKIEVEIRGEVLISEGQEQGMITDFGKLKNDLKALAENFDHAFIYEKDSLMQATIEALKNEHFKLIEVDFRPTAENFSEYFYKSMKSKGYDVKKLTVYETPNNCASYSE